MTPAYWDAVAADYDREVLSVFAQDTAGMVRARILAAGRVMPGARAADLGCGVGTFVPLLASTFTHVHACDWSTRGMLETRRRCASHANVSYASFDLAEDAAPFDPVEFVLCVNVLIMPSMDERRRAWRAVTNQLSHGGRLVLVVPSWESIQVSAFNAIEESLGAGCTCTESLSRHVTAEASVADLCQGVHALRGVRTKAYVREELEQMVGMHECEVNEITKLGYPAIGSCTWDWLVTATRR